MKAKCQSCGRVVLPKNGKYECKSCDISEKESDVIWANKSYEAEKRVKRKELSEKIDNLLGDYYL